MEYHGKLYGHLGGKRYFDTSHTTEEWDSMLKKIADLEAENQALRLHGVVGQSELLNSFLEYAEPIYWGENNVTDRKELIEPFLKKRI
jgi:hypothetical protein